MKIFQKIPLVAFYEYKVNFTIAYVTRVSEIKKIQWGMKRF